MRHVAGLGEAVLNLLLPPVCLTCDASVDALGRLCAPCFARTTFITRPLCRRCGAAFSHAGQIGDTGHCPQCEAIPPPWNQARAALRYDTQSRRLILPMKHGDRPELARWLAVMMVRAGADVLDTADLLVPVPLHPQRLRARGYNQAALLARRVAQIRHLPVRLDTLVRLRVTPSLADLSAERRQAVLHNAFAPRRGVGNPVAGKRIVLIDDVLTSGATCTACTLALLAAGAANVDVLVVARVPDPRLDPERHLAAKGV